MPPQRKAGWQDRFLAIYEESCVVAYAVRGSGISSRTYYRELHRNPDFKARVADAEVAVIKRLEEVAVERALAGHSDTLLIFLLKANRPAKYREHFKIDHGGSVTVIEQNLDEEIEHFLEANDSASQSPNGGGDPGASLGNGSKPGSDAA